MTTCDFGRVYAVASSQQSSSSTKTVNQSLHHSLFYSTCFSPPLIDIPTPSSQEAKPGPGPYPPSRYARATAGIMTLDQALSESDVEAFLQKLKAAGEIRLWVLSLKSVLG